MTSPIVLYAWQAEALDAWRRVWRRGVVEAVTGAGKTMVGVAAVSEALSEGGQALVVVPTVELLHQWAGHICRHFPTITPGLVGDGEFATFRTHDVIIAVVNSLRLYELQPPRNGSLLVADECHRYGSAANALTLDSRFSFRLGLSATYARSDDAHTTILDSYFGGVCYQLTYARALADEVTAHFKVALLGVHFERQEWEQYEAANLATTRAQRWLRQNLNISPEPFGKFMRDVSVVARGSGGGAGYARSFLSNFELRRRILAETPAKRRALTGLAPALRAADRGLVFTQTIAAAEDAADILRATGLPAYAIHSRQDRELRRSLLKQFAHVSGGVVTAPQVLDEGIDVPSADIAIILASSKSRRQMVQRMGRVLRRKDDGRLARFVILFVHGTSEDPSRGAHEDFLDEILPVADTVKTFSAAVRPQAVVNFLNDMTTDSPQPSPRLALA
jgi:RNA polymerase primary sigma factor